MDALGDAFGFAVAEAVFDHGVAVGGVEFADGVFDAGELDGGDAEFFDAEADEERREGEGKGRISSTWPALCVAWHSLHPPQSPHFKGHRIRSHSGCVIQGFPVLSNRPRLPMTEEKELTDEECASAIANDLSLSTDDLLLEIYKEVANTAQKAGPQMAKTTAKSAILSLSIIKEQALIHHQLARLTRYLTWLTVMLAILTLGLLGVTIGLLHYASQADEHLHRIRELAEE